MNKMITLEAAQDREFIYTVDPADFERMVAQIYADFGFEVSITPETRDGGIDIIATRNIGMNSSVTMYIQCKRNRKDRPVNVDTLRSFDSVVRYGYTNRGVVVTTSYFTHDAIRFVEERGDLYELINGDSLYEMIKESASRYYEKLRN